MEFHDAFRAMDTDIDVFVECATNPAGAFPQARLAFEQQEQRFSRFRETSLLSRLNRGETVADPGLVEAVEMAIDAWETTGGRFNPMVLPALRAAGYDRTFREVAGGRAKPLPAPTPADCIEINGDTVRLTGGAMDLGGLVKGWTADLVAEALADRWGNAMVNAGGDIRCVGSDGAGPGWALEVAGIDADSVAWAGRVTGAIATSTTLKRRWTMDDGRPAHHLIDPATGLPSDSEFVQVTARADECWIAEVWAKAVLIGGPEKRERAEAQGIALVTFDASGRAVFSGDW
ncbi:MAG TPA: FAD:protein FMN transferase [Tepidiformaceae bacterium]|nr:FAD:protein FMN transferase [Tepidiformaceae bacterium]